MDKRIEIHAEVCKEIHDLYIDKNADYGDSFRKVRNEIPNAILVRLSDKLNRLKNLMCDESEYHIKDETIDDTLMDLANYAMLEIVERRMDNLPKMENEPDGMREIFRESIRDWIINEKASNHTEIFLKHLPISHKIRMNVFEIENGKITEHNESFYKDDKPFTLTVNMEDDDDSED